MILQMLLVSSFSKHYLLAIHPYSEIVICDLELNASNVIVAIFIP